MRCFVVAAVVAATGCPSLGSVYADRDDVVVESDVAYADDGLAAHRLDLYAPRSVDVGVPVVVFFHGGKWIRQDKEFWEFATGVYGNVGVALAREGFVVANANYRLYPDGSFDDMLDDVDAAVSFVEARYPYAPVVVMGHSSGAHLASAVMLLHRHHVDAFVGVSGIYDIENVATFADEDDRAVLDDLFGDKAGQRAASTARLFRTSDIPALFVVGREDFPVVRVEWFRMEDRLQARTDDNVSDGEFVEVNGTHEDTAIDVGGPDDDITPAVVEFLAGRGIRSR